jgi:hypothetical protein
MSGGVNSTVYFKSDTLVPLLRARDYGGARGARHRHCERSEAISIQFGQSARDCRVGYASSQ